MSYLQDLYAERNIFSKYGQEIPTELAEKIEQAERAIIQSNIIETIAAVLPESVDTGGIQKPITIAAKYLDGKLNCLGISLDENAIDQFNIVSDFSEDETGEDEGGDTERSRSASRPFRILFVDDNKEFKYNKAQWTLIDALKHIGLERVSHFQGETFKGFPLVGKQQRITPDGQVWQKNVDGWWIYVNMSNARKMRCLQKVADSLGIKVEISYI